MAKLHFFLAFVQMEVNGQQNSTPQPQQNHIYLKAGTVKQKVDHFGDGRILLPLQGTEPCTIQAVD